jgi:RNA polymerase sigma-70 factor (ECF subfamily)
MTILDGKALLDHSKSIARRHAGRLDAETAKDLGSEAVLRALRSPAPDGNMQPWLERIFHNLFVDTWRRQPPACVPLEGEILTSGQSPEEAVLQHERRQAVRAHLAQLPREARQALLSRYYGELEPAAAAARLGVAPATVRTRIYRGLSRLRVVLADLRALVPPGIAHLWTAKSTALAMAPVLVVALAAVETRPQAPAPTTVVRALAARPVSARPALAQASPTREQAPAPITVEPKPRTRTVHAQPVVATQPDPSPVPTKVFEFEDDQLVGEIQRPDREDLYGRPASAKQKSLIEIPDNFVAQFQKMVEDRL